MRASSSSNAVVEACAGAAILAVAMGFGRFAYTPLLVIMERDAGLSVANSGMLASMNLAGYLIGALLAMHPELGARRSRVIAATSTVVVVSTALMLLPPAWWPLARFITGVASGVAFILTTSLFLDRAAASATAAPVGIVFAGVGAGITVAGLLVSACASLAGSRGAWLGLAVVSAMLVAGALPQLPSERRARRKPGDSSSIAPLDAPFIALAIAYTIEGFAYIIPATYLVAMVSATPAIAKFSALAWVIVGLAACAAGPLWSRTAQCIGRHRALLVALVVQTAGLATAALLAGLFGALVLAVTLGATFTGIALLVGAIARELRPRATSAAFGALSGVYGIGQVIGPLAGVRLTLATGSYRSALALAAIALTTGMFVFAIQARKVLEGSV